MPSETVDLGYVLGDTGPTGPIGPTGPVGPVDFFFYDELPEESEIVVRPAVVVTKNGGMYYVAE